jgi:hypothetical protein
VGWNPKTTNRRKTSRKKPTTKPHKKMKMMLKILKVSLLSVKGALSRNWLTQVQATTAAIKLIIPCLMMQLPRRRLLKLRSGRHGSLPMKRI